MRRRRLRSERQIYKQLSELSNECSSAQTELNKYLIKDAIKNRRIDKNMVWIGVGGNLVLHLLKTWLDVKVIPQYAPKFKM